VSGEWAGWLGANRAMLESVTMLTGSRFIQITAEFVRRFSSLEGSMRICYRPGHLRLRVAARNEALDKKQRSPQPIQPEESTPTAALLSVN
jgi:hypothetical protein